MAGCGPPRPRITRKELIRAAWGTHDDWDRACYRAAREGYSPAEITRILNLYHPSTIFIYVAVAFALGLLAWGFIRR